MTVLIKRALILACLIMVTTSCTSYRISHGPARIKPLQTDPWTAGHWEGSVIEEESEPQTGIRPRPEVPDFRSTPSIVLADGVGVLRFLVSRNNVGICQFKPSCGEYSLRAIRGYGPFFGFLMTGDRLLRCNRNAHSQGYREKKINGRRFLIDPPHDNSPVVYLDDSFVPHAGPDVEYTLSKNPAKKKTAKRRRLFRKLSAPDGKPPFLETLANRPIEERKLFRFALGLMKNGHVYRAITEFYRFASYFPASPLVGEAHVLAGECYGLGGQWSCAEMDYRRGRVLLPGPGHAFVDLRIAAAAYFQDKFDVVAAQAEKVFSYKQKRLSETMRYLLFLSSVRKRDLKSAAKELEMLCQEFPGSPERWAIEETPESILSGEQLPNRSPFLGACFSAVIPGLGQAYSGRIGDGLSAFMMVGLLGSASYMSFRDDAEVPGYLFGAVAVSFYLANIYNGGNLARMYNIKAENDFYGRVRKQSFFDHLRLAPGEEGGVFVGLGYSF